MLNRSILVGRLTRDPELRVSQNNISVTTFNLAVNRPFTNQNGEQQADFINCIAFRKNAENVSQYLKKGSLAGIDGRIQTRNYENKDGHRVYVTEVVCDSVQFLEPKSQNQGAQRQNQSQGTNYSNNQNNATQGGYGSNNNSYQNAYSGQQNNQNQQNGNNEPNPFNNPSGSLDISDDLPF